MPSFWWFQVCVLYGGRDLQLQGWCVCSSNPCEGRRRLDHKQLSWAEYPQYRRITVWIEATESCPKPSHQVPICHSFRGRECGLAHKRSTHFWRQQLQLFLSKTTGKMVHILNAFVGIRLTVDQNYSKHNFISPEHIQTFVSFIDEPTQHNEHCMDLTLSQLPYVIREYGKPVDSTCRSRANSLPINARDLAPTDFDILGGPWNPFCKCQVPSEPVSSTRTDGNTMTCTIFKNEDAFGPQQLRGKNES